LVSVFPIVFIALGLAFGVLLLIKAVRVRREKIERGEAPSPSAAQRIIWLGLVVALLVLGIALLR
jgi:hypothetical protein